MTKPDQANSSTVWGPTQDGVRQHLPTKIWHFNKKVHRHLISGSSETTSKTLAKAKLVQKIADLLKQPGLMTAPVKNGRQTFAEVIEKFKHRINGSNLNPRTKDKKLHVLNSLLDSWRKVPGFPEDLRNLTALPTKQLHFDQWVSWRAFFLSPKEEGGLGLSHDYFNQARSIVCDLYDIARENNPLLENLGQKLDFAKVFARELILPTAEKFAEIVDCISEGGCNGATSAAEDLIRGLSYTGLRINEARQLRKRHVDLANGEINLPASIVKGKKTARTVPIFPEARALFTRLVAEAGPDGEIFHVSEATETLRKACKLAGWKPALTHHDLRHYFATRCLESTKDVKVVAQWMGHIDGGALVLQTYAHVCAKFANQAARLVVFEKKEAATSGAERIAHLEAELAKLKKAEGRTE